MSKHLKLLAGFGFVVALAACAREPVQEPVFVEPAPVAAEPTYNKF